jgi:hypothetical protein
MKIKISLKDQVVDRNTAEKLTKKLASVGIEVESVFVWYRPHYWFRKDFKLKRVDWGLGQRPLPSLDSDVPHYDIIPAPTLPELLAVLPDSVSNNIKLIFVRTLTPGEIGYVYGPYDSPLLGKDYSPARVYIDDKTNPATAVAKLAIWCIDEGHIKGEDKADDQ